MGGGGSCTCSTAKSKAPADDREGSLFMWVTASCAAALGRALAKMGSHPHGPTTPTRNHAACAEQGSKLRRARRRSLERACLGQGERTEKKKEYVGKKESKGRLQ